MKIVVLLVSLLVAAAFAQEESPDDQDDLDLDLNFDAHELSERVSALEKSNTRNRRLQEEIPELRQKLKETKEKMAKTNGNIHKLCAFTRSVHRAAEEAGHQVSLGIRGQASSIYRLSKRLGNLQWKLYRKENKYTEEQIKEYMAAKWTKFSTNNTKQEEGTKHGAKGEEPKRKPKRSWGQWFSEKKKGARRWASSRYQAVKTWWANKQKETHAPKPETADQTADPAPKPETADPTADPAPKPETADQTADPTPKPETADPTSDPAPKPETADQTADPTPKPETADLTADPTPKPTTVDLTADLAPKSETADPTADPTPKPLTADQISEPESDSMKSGKGEAAVKSGRPLLFVNPGLKSGRPDLELDEVEKLDTSVDSATPGVKKAATVGLDPNTVNQTESVEDHIQPSGGERTIHIQDLP